MPAARKNTTDIYVAKHSFACEIAGDRIVVNAGERVRAGHPMLDSCGDYFDLVEDAVTYDVEQATSAPGEQRGDR